MALYQYLIKLTDDQDFVSYLIKVERYQYQYKTLLLLYQDWVKTGNLDLLKTAERYTKQPILLHYLHQSLAAQFDQIEVLRYLKSIDCPVNERIYDDLGSVRVARWIKRNYPKLNPTELTFINAAKNGDLDLIKFLTPKIITKDVLVAAAKNGYLDILVYLDQDYHKLIKTYEKPILLAAIEEGYLEIVQWMPKSYYGGSDLTAKAAYCGYLDILIYLRSDGCPWDSRVCANAAVGGYLPIIKWARSKKAPWNSNVCGNAAQYGYLNLLKWTLKHGAPVPANILDLAIKSERLDLVIWLYNLGYTKFNDEALSLVTSNFDLIKWLRERGARFNYEVSKEYHEEEGHEILVHFDEGLRELVKNAILAGSIDFLLWLRNEQIFADLTDDDKGYILDMILDSDNIQVLKFFLDSNIFLLNHNFYVHLIRSNKTDILLWVNQHYPRDALFAPGMANVAIEADNLGLAQWLIESGSSFNTWAFYYASENNNVEILDYLQTQNIRDEVMNKLEFYYVAAENGNFEAIKWLIKHNFPKVAQPRRVVRKIDAVILALDNGYPEIAIYLADEGFKLSSKAKEKMRILYGYRF